MRKVILDTSFILTCVKQKIDFFEEINLMGIKIVIPKQVLSEIKKILTSKKKLRFREDAKLSLEILEKNKFESIDLGRGHVDKLLIKFAETNSQIIVATLDKELKKKVKNRKMIIQEKKRLKIL